MGPAGGALGASFARGENIDVTVMRFRWLDRQNDYRALSEKLEARTEEERAFKIAN